MFALLRKIKRRQAIGRAGKRSKLGDGQRKFCNPIFGKFDFAPGNFIFLIMFVGARVTAQPKFTAGDADKIYKSPQGNLGTQNTAHQRHGQFWLDGQKQGAVCDASPGEGLGIVGSVRSFVTGPGSSCLIKLCVSGFRGVNRSSRDGDRVCS